MSRASVTCLLAWGRVLRSSSQLSRASVTFLLGVELGVYVFFVGVKGVVDVLAGFCLGIYFFVGVKSVDDVLAGRGAGC